MIQSIPAAAASATDWRDRACMATGRPSRWASSTASSSSSSRNAPYSVVPGPDPAILIRSTPSLTSSRISAISSSVPRTRAPNDDSSMSTQRGRVSPIPCWVVIWRPAADILGPWISPASMASRTAAATPVGPPGSQALVTPASSTFSALAAARTAR